MDLFAAAMLGMADVIHKAVEVIPGIYKSLGPHKIPPDRTCPKGETLWRLRF